MSKTKYKIIALFGPAGSGKDYIQKQIMETDWGKNHLNEIVSCTTRPPREGEVDGIHYNFITDNHFKELLSLNKILEYTVFRGWYYGTPIENLNSGKINLGVFNRQGIETLLEKEDCEVLPVFIYTYDKLRLMRQLVREVNPDCTEICRRFLSDQDDFLNLPFCCKVIENNTDEVQPILQELISLIEEWSEVKK